MIQRIQTLYLFIVALLMGIMHLVPLAGMGFGGEGIELTIYGLRSVGDGARSVMSFPYMGILVSLSCLLAIVIIFLYKRRQLQIRLCFAELVMLLGAQIFTVLYIIRLRSSSAVTMDMIRYNITIVLPIICVILTYLALRAIIKDEAKVRSMDRIR